MSITPIKAETINLTDAILAELDLDRIIALETDGREGTDCIFFYYVDGEELKRFEIADENNRLKAKIREKVLENEAFGLDFSEVECGAGHKFIWRRACHLDFEEGFILFDYQYRVDVSSAAIFERVKTWPGVRGLMRCKVGYTDAEFGFLRSVPTKL